MAGIALKIDESWKARRTDEGSWYFYHKETQATKWTGEAPFDYSNADLDRMWIDTRAAALRASGSAELASLPPPSEKAKSETELLLRSRNMKQRHAHLLKIETVPLHPDESIMSTGPWLHASRGISASADTAVHAHLATALLASHPAPFSRVGKSAELCDEWLRLVAEAAKPDAVLRPEIRQMIAASHVITADTDIDGAGLQSMTSIRMALGEELDCNYSQSATLASVYSALLNKHTATVTAADLAPPGIPRAASGVGVRFASSTSDGSAASQFLHLGSMPITNLLLPEDGISTATAAGNEIANARAVSTFCSSYSEDVGSTMLTAIDQPHDSTWLLKLKDTLGQLFQNEKWCNGLIRCVQSHPTDTFLRSTAAILFRRNAFMSLTSAPVLQFSSKAFAATLINTMRTASATARVDAPFVDEMWATLGSSALAAAVRSFGTREELSAQCLRLARAKQESTLSNFSSSNPVALVCLTSPVDPNLLAGDVDNDGVFHAMLPGVLQQSLVLRRICMSRFPSLRADFFPEEDHAHRCIEAEKSQQFLDDDADAGDDVKIQRVRNSFLLATPLIESDVQELKASLDVLGQYALDAATLEEFEQNAKQLIESIQNGGDESGEASLTHSNMTAILGAADHLQHLLTQPDVLTVLIHIIFNPSLDLEDKSSAEPGTHTEMFANLLSMSALNIASGVSSDTTLHSCIDWNSMCGVPQTVLRDGASKSAWASSLAQALIGTSQLIKAPGALSAVTALASGDGQALRALATLLAEGTARPIVAIGLLHWMQHALAGVEASDPHFISTCNVLLRSSSLLCQRWPLLLPNAFNLACQCFLRAGRDANSLRQRVTATFLTYVARGYVLPVLQFVHLHATRVEFLWLQNFVLELSNIAAPPYSAQFGLLFAKVVEVAAEKGGRLADDPSKPGALASSADAKMKLRGIIMNINETYIKPAGSSAAELREVLKLVERNWKHL